MQRSPHRQPAEEAGKEKVKTKLAVAFATLLSVADAFAQQYILPIGSNVNNRPAKVGVSIVNRDTGWGVSDEFDYTPAMGELENIVKNRLSRLAENLSPPTGSEHDSYSLGAVVVPGPSYTPILFTLQSSGNKLAVPPEVLDIKLDYGVGTGWKLPGITAVSLNLYKDGSPIKLWTTKDKSSGDSACDIGSAQSVLALGWATINKEYAFPWLKENWWDTSEVTIEAYDGWATFYNANGSPRDGELIAVSEPPPAFLESLRVPEIQSASQAPVLVLASPKISRISRVGSTTEITVSAEASGNAHLEFATAIGGNWSAVPAYPVPLALKAGSTQFTHTIESPTAFYRLRVVKTEGQ